MSQVDQAVNEMMALAIDTEISGWIPVGYLVPPNSKPVLVTDGTHLSIANYFDKTKAPGSGEVGPAMWVNQHTRLSRGFYIREEDITHWMPMETMHDLLLADLRAAREAVNQ